MEAKHVKYCEKCNRKYYSESALEQHFRASSVHPNCARCGAGIEHREALALVSGPSSCVAWCFPRLKIDGDLSIWHMNTHACDVVV